MAGAALRSRCGYESHLNQCRISEELRIDSLCARPVPLAFPRNGKRAGQESLTVGSWRPLNSEVHGLVSTAEQSAPFFVLQRQCPLQKAGATEARQQTKMRILFIGDIVGAPGRQIVQDGWRISSRSGRSTWSLLTAKIRHPASHHAPACRRVARIGH